LGRYVVDIYAGDVPGKYKQDIAYGAATKAHLQVIKIRQLWENWDRCTNHKDSP
jgi:hypothetical protein